MLSVILDFKTDGLDTVTCNLLAASYILVDNDTSEAIGSIAHLVAPQHEIGDLSVIPASSSTLARGLPIDVIKNICQRVLSKPDVTHIIVANKDFDLGILSNKLDITITNKVFIDLNTTLKATPIGIEKMSVNKDTSFDMLAHIHSMYTLVRTQGIADLITLVNEPRKLYTYYVDHRDTAVREQLEEIGFRYHTYYGKHVAFMRDKQCDQLCYALEKAGDKDIAKAIRKQFDKHTEIVRI